jgi:glucosamine-6-phosphate deaminase
VSRAVARGQAASGALAVELFESDTELGERAAQIILEAHRAAATEHRGLVLGCPAGRSPRSTYAALGALAAHQRVDLSQAHLVLMDEFVVRDGERWRWCPADAHYSCRGFAAREILPALNAGLPVARQLSAAALHVPDPQDPAAFERTIEQLGGIDVFLLASGGSDGHVAFNGPGTSLDSTTRVVELAETTRRDNLGTFPQFRELEDVPRWGVTIGLGTIRRQSRAVVLLLAGAGKCAAARRVLGAQAFDPAWAATLVHACRHATVLTDRAAYSGAENATCAN